MESIEFLLILFVGIQARSVIGGINPVIGPDTPSDAAIVEADEFLTSYGYYPSSGLLPAQGRMPNFRIHSDFERTKALKLFQKFYQLPQSGQLDKETTQLIQSPRCGNPDITSNQSIVRTGEAIELQKKEIVDRTRKDNMNQNREESGFDVLRGRRSLDTSWKKRVKRMAGVRKHGVLRKWRRGKLEWKIGSGTKQLPRDDLRQIVTEAASIWQQAVPVLFVEIDEYQEADMKIIVHSFATSSWNDSTHRDHAWRKNKRIKIKKPKNAPKRKGSHAHAMVLESDEFTPQGDIHIDEDYDWSNREELLSVLLHEIGHVLGLAHSNHKNAVMYPFNRDATELSFADLRGIKTVYGSNRRLNHLLCDARLREVDHIFQDPTPILLKYYAISGGKVQQFAPPVGIKGLVTSKGINQYFPGVPSMYDVVFSNKSNGRVLFIKGDKLYQYEKQTDRAFKRLPTTRIRSGIIPETPLFAVTLQFGNEIWPFIFGKKYSWLFKFEKDGETISKPDPAPHLEYLAEHLSNTKFALQWTDGLVYAFTRNGSYFMPAFTSKPTSGSSPLTLERGTPDWLKAMLCRSHATCIRISRPSLVLFILLSLIKLY